MNHSKLKIGLILVVMMILISVEFFYNNNSVRTVEVSKEYFMEKTNASMIDINKGLKARNYEAVTDKISFAKFEYEKAAYVILEGATHKVDAHIYGYCVMYENKPIRLYNLQVKYNSSKSGLEIIPKSEVGYALGDTGNNISQTILVKANSGYGAKEQTNNLLIDLDFE